MRYPGNPRKPQNPGIAGPCVIEDAEGLGYDVRQLQTWLQPLDSQAKVECDGMSRLIAHLLSKSGIPYIVATGHLVDLQRLNDPVVPRSAECGVTHVWLELGYEYIVDFRARMWMGEEAQHGVFIPQAGRFEYRTKERISFAPLSEGVLEVMCGVRVSDWPIFSLK